jgi:hypothetical protein|nr:hypothetical protein AUSP0033_00038 [uncultured phage]
MTVGDYIKQKFQSFGSLSKADLLDIVLNSGLEEDDEISTNNIDMISIAIAEYIPSLLLRPKAIDENGFSISWDFDSLKEYYAYLCRKYDLEDQLNGVSSIKDVSDIW